MRNRHVIALFVLVALVYTAPADAAGIVPTVAKGTGCRGVDLSASRHRIPVGGFVRIRGRVCGRGGAGRRVVLALRGPHGWQRDVIVREHRDGKFTRRLALAPAAPVRTVNIRAHQRSRHSESVSIHLREPKIAPAAAPVAPAPSGCALSGVPGEVVEMTAPGCEVIASDTSVEPSPIRFWGSIQCASESRYAYVPSAGDTHPSASGAAQPDKAYRSLTVLDGDEYAGERCELGENDHRTSPTALYHEGQHLVTYFSERLPSNFPLATGDWQTVMQMKQAQPSDNGGGAPILEMEARGNRWAVVDNWQELWSFPAQSETWTRFAWDVFYSQDPAKGWLQVSVDLNGDGDFNDPGERSPVFHVATLKTEIEGPNGDSDGLAAGESIPSQLRMGIYHDPAIPCPAPSGCSVDVDNVQVVG